MIWQFHFWVYIQKNESMDMKRYLFKAAKRWKQPKCPLTDKWTNKMWHIHIMEYYSALKSKEIMTHGTICMNLEDIILTEISQSQKNNNCLIPLI